MFVEREKKREREFKVLVFSHEKKDALTDLVVPKALSKTLQIKL